MSHKIPLFKHWMGDVSSSLKKVLNSDNIDHGSKVEEFEERLKNYFNASGVILTNSYTSSIQLSLKLLDLTSKDEVITSPIARFETNSVIYHSGARIRWADISLHDLNIDLEDVERKINQNTKVIMAFHWGGSPVSEDLIDVVKRANKMYDNNIVIIEDCSHAFGSNYINTDVHVGTNSGVLGCFSFQSDKNPTCIDGGCLVVGDKYYKRVKSMLGCELGFNWSMNSISATIGLENFENYSWIISAQKENAKYYYDHLWPIALASNERLQLFQLPYQDSSCYLFAIMVDDRELFQKMMSQKGIETSPVNMRNDNHSCFYDYRSLLPNLNYLAKYIVCIPSGWWVTKEDREYIVNCINGGW